MIYSTLLRTGLLIIIVPAFAGMTILFLFGLCALFGSNNSVNPCLIEGNLKKQNQRRPSAGNSKH